MKKLKLQNKNFTMFADIHTHILHSIDDGSSSVDESLELLKREVRQGVTHVALTPHFDLESMSVEEFLKKRQDRYTELLCAVKKEPELSDLKLHLGAEVLYSPNLVNIPAQKLVISDTNFILIELTIAEPFNIEETLEYFNSLGIIPIFAHVERYGYLRSRKRLLRYRNMGVIMQSNTSALLSKISKAFVTRMIKKGCIDILASDSHNINERSPKWDESLKTLRKSDLEKIKRNSKLLFSHSTKQ